MIQRRNPGFSNLRDVESSHVLASDYENKDDYSFDEQAARVNFETKNCNGRSSSTPSKVIFEVVIIDLIKMMGYLL